jgi:fatty acid desaturase
MSTIAPRAALGPLLPGRGLTNARSLIGWALFDWAVIAASWIVMAAFESPLVRVAGIVLVASRLHALGVILHDACHRPMRKKTAAWWFVEALCGWPIGSTIAAMRYHHLRHHRDSGMRTDPYRHPWLVHGALVRVALTLRGALLPFWWTLRAFVAPLALLVPRARTLYARAFLQDRSGQSLRSNAEVIACARADLFQAGAHTVTGAAIVAFDLPFVSCYLLPWMLGGILNARRVIIEHSFAENRDRSRATTLATTRTHDAGRLANWLLYPHHIGFHQAHHLFPTIAFVYLPRVHGQLLGRRPPTIGENSPAVCRDVARPAPHRLSSQQ